jgi:hypothetical protein
MPTVKLQNGNVILKGGKVSCSCCAVEPDCCMYPADGLGDTFEAADLPATLYGKWDDRADGTFTKSTDTFTRGTVTIRVNSGGTAWEFYDSDDATLTIGNCLIRGDGNITPGDDAVEDQFEDCYEVTGEFISGAVQVIRNSLCEWNYEFDGEFESGGFFIIFDAVEQKWKYNGFFTGFNEEGYKTGNQSSPVGTYNTDWTTDSNSGTSSKTVTECS